MPDTVKKSTDNLYDIVIDNIVKEKGGSRDVYENLLYQISNLESGGDPTIKQISGGPGRGKYQMETGVGYEKAYGEDGKHQKGHFKKTSNRIFYSAVRTKNYLKTLGQETPDFIKNIIENETGDASTLSEKQQDVLALGDLRMGPVNLGDYISGDLKGKDIYLDNWWAGKDEEHRKKLSNRWDNAYPDDFVPRTDLGIEQGEDINPFMQQPIETKIDNTRVGYDQKNNKGFSQKDFHSFLNDRMQNSENQPQPEKFQDSNPNVDNQISLLAEGVNQKANGGMLNHFKGGGTHDENPMGGIPQGIGDNGKPNTVEEDETSYDFPEGKFIFSNRINTYGESFNNTTDKNKYADGGKMEKECGGPGQPPCNKEIKKDNSLFGYIAESVENVTNTANNVKDFISGNVDEFIKTPIYNKISDVTNGVLGNSDNTQSVAMNKYDNTKGKLKNLSNVENSDIKNESNISQRQVYPNSFSNITSNARKANAASLHPMGYNAKQTKKTYVNNFKKSLKSSGYNNLSDIGKQAEKGNVQMQNRIDAFNFYSGVPQKYDTFTISDYKAGEDKAFTFKDKSKVNSYLIKAAISTDLFDNLDNGTITPESINSDENKKLEGGNKVNKHSFRDNTNNVMWNATFGIGYDDDKKPYLSFYDKWDLAPDVVEASGKAFDIYDRLPIDKKQISDLKKLRYTPDNSGISMPDDSEKGLESGIDELRSKYGIKDLKNLLNKAKNQDIVGYRKALGVSKSHYSSLVKNFGKKEADRLISVIDSIYTKK